MTLSATIAELRKLEAEATKGPWEYGEHGTVDAGGTSILWDDMGIYDDDPNARFVVAMRNALPHLLDRLAKLELVADAARANAFFDTPFGFDGLRCALAALEEK